MKLNKVIRSADEMTETSFTHHDAGELVALVPTMGALHAGHLSLVEEANKHADRVILSIYVNPTQFSPNEDLGSYPRDLEKDIESLKSVGGVDYIFRPSNDQIYDLNHAIWIQPDGLDKVLCGRYRPNHFRGVCTIVYKLFLICIPHVAIFGKKDAQQFIIIKAMARDLMIDVEILGLETVREKDGLAMSSRNAYLSEKERKSAPILQQALRVARAEIERGERSIERLVGNIRNLLKSVDEAEIQYVEAVDSMTLDPIESLLSGQEILIAMAVYFGKTRLIDNAFIEVPMASQQ